MSVGVLESWFDPSHYSTAPFTLKLSSVFSNGAIIEAKLQKTTGVFCRKDAREKRLLPALYTRLGLANFVARLLRF